MHWYVEKDVFPENEEKLSQVLGDRLTFVRRQSLLTGIETLDGSPVEQTGIFYGSIQLARHLQDSFLFYLTTTLIAPIGCLITERWHSITLTSISKLAASPHVSERWGSIPFLFS